MSAAVAPDALPGVWERELLVRPDGSRDETTRVLWFQARALFADIRLPAGDPVSTPEGFAGRTEMSPDGDALICEWRRLIDWSPGGPADVGRLTWIDDGRRLREDGVAADYYEIWRRTATPRPGDGAWTFRAQDRGQAIVALIAGRFLLAAGRDGQASDIVLGRSEGDGWISEASLSDASRDALGEKMLGPKTLGHDMRAALSSLAMLDVGGAPLAWDLVDSEIF